MSDISELETRITSALERISTGLSLLDPKTSGAQEERDKLQLELDEERKKAAQLETQLETLDKNHQSTADAEVQRLRDQLALEENKLAQLRSVNADLRDNNNALRDAAREGVVEPHLINKAMIAELEGLRASHAADRAELDAVLIELGALIEENEPSSAVTGKENADA